MIMQLLLLDPKGTFFLEGKSLFMNVPILYIPESKRAEKMSRILNALKQCFQRR